MLQMYIGDIVHTYPFGPRLSASRVGGVYTGDGAAPGSSPTPYSATGHVSFPPYTLPRNNVRSASYSSTYRTLTRATEARALILQLYSYRRRMGITVVRAIMARHRWRHSQYVLRGWD